MKEISKKQTEFSLHTVNNKNNIEIASEHKKDKDSEKISKPNFEKLNKTKEGK